MKLKVLAKGLGLTIRGSKEVEITGIASDSRFVAPGNLFIAKRGSNQDGAQFISQALQAGACAIATDFYDPFLEVTQIIHPHVVQIEAKLASRYYGHPSKHLYVVGVTGTKGKTTTVYLIKHLLDHLQKPCGLLSSIEIVTGQNRFPSTLTTHDVISNQKWLKEMTVKGCQAVALEVSSHGLDQGRVEEIDFDVGVFTNFYPDHLDYHRTIEQYAAAKAKLLTKAKQAVLNADSYWGDFSGFKYGIQKGDVRASELECSANGTSFTVNHCRFYSPLIGTFNVYNNLAAISVGLLMGAKIDEIRDILALFGSVPARMERIGSVFVDFAHTGEALANVLQTLREICKGKIIVIFGCGGDRDPGRRTGMAKAAEQWADISIVTTDNPRREDPVAIANQIVAGYQVPEKVIVELDRKQAIQKGIRMARAEDLVLVAGKGHERMQIFAHQTIPFDDVAIVKEELLQ